MSLVSFSIASSVKLALIQQAVIQSVIAHELNGYNYGENSQMQKITKLITCLGQMWIVMLGC